MSTLSFADEFRPEGFRKVAAILLLLASTSLPAVHAWQYGEEEAAPPANVPRGFPQVGMHGPFARQAPEEPEERGASWSTWLAIIGGAGGLMLYYPRRGFKRYGLLFGPALGLGAMLLTTLWLAGRQEVHRFELVFAAMLGAAPGLLMYLGMASLKFHRLARQQIPVASAHYVEDAVDAQVIG